MTTPRLLCLFLLAVASGTGVADGVVEVPVERFHAGAVEVVGACVEETEVDLESCWLDEGV